MKLTIIPALIISFGFAISCSNSREHNNESVKSNKTEANTEGDHNQSNTEITISLNNGAKWNSDESTFTGMKRLELTLYNFNKENDAPTVEAYNKLGVALANIDKDIISECSMEGKDHDQLHIILVPMLANVDVIKNGDDKIAAKENMDALTKSVAQFFEHFEVK
ncbi:MAG: hypothetical protein DRI71_04130 [Bacteroidetes bacterium]|nr:MAG: hypothetical protein DRI71_04130 [Bacteroidota bacterium]